MTRKKEPRTPENLMHYGRIGAEALFEEWRERFGKPMFTKTQEDALQQGFAWRMLELFTEARNAK